MAFSVHLALRIALTVAPSGAAPFGALRLGSDYRTRSAGHRVRIA